MFAHSEKELHKMSHLIPAAAVSFGLTINLAKTEVLHQRQPNDTSTQTEVNIVLNSVKLNQVSHLTYLGSILSNDALLDKEIAARIRKASCSFGRLCGRVWNERGIKTSTKVKVNALRRIKRIKREDRESVSSEDRESVSKTL